MPRSRVCGDLRGYVVAGVMEVHACSKEAGHDGRHADGYKQWNRKRSTEGKA